ncbi:MAG: NADAR family protein [Myxococcota bacterium]
MANVIAFRKVSEPFGWLGNMAPFPVTVQAMSYRTTEALFQALRFCDHPDIQEEIRKQTSPMAAKMIAKKHRSRLDPVTLYNKADLDRMRLCLSVKVAQHPALAQMLLDTGDARIIEDCTRRPHGSGLYWGAALVGDEWEGENWLGRLWMERRSALAAES